MSTRTEERIRGGVGERAGRVDGVPKVKGTFAYGSDLWHERMLWGTTLRSPHPHARIRSIDITQALTSPGVLAVLTVEDVPGKQTYGLEFADQPVLAGDRVRYAGEPVAVVAAETPELARRAKVQGKVILQAVVRKDGTVGDVQVLQSPGSKLGFDEAAVEAVRQWRYKPGLQNGKPVDVYFTIIVEFYLTQ